MSEEIEDLVAQWYYIMDEVYLQNILDALSPCSSGA